MDEIQQLMVSSKLNVKKEEQYYTIDLPDNYYHYLRSYSYVGNCTIDNWLVREGDINVLLNDEVLETFFRMGEKLSVL